MNDATMKLSPPEAVAIPLCDIEILLAAGNGDATLLYLHILRNGGVLDGATAATELHRSDRDIRETAERLCQMGILTASTGTEKRPTGQPLLSESELPEYQSQDVVRQSMEDPAFQNLVEEVQHILGRILSPAELKKLLAIHRELAMPTEVVMMLVQHCREQFGGNVGFRAIEKEANDWFQREIVTVEQADQWLRRLHDRKDGIGQFQRELHLENLSPTARNNLNEWMDMGYGAEALILAADRTMTKLGRIHWGYMRSIIKTWKEKGLYTVEQIQQGDKRPGMDSAAARDDSKTLEQLARLREKMKNS